MSNTGETTMSMSYFKLIVAGALMAVISTGCSSKYQTNSLPETRNFHLPRDMNTTRVDKEAAKKMQQFEMARKKKFEKYTDSYFNDMSKIVYRGDFYTIDYKNRKPY